MLHFIIFVQASPGSCVFASKDPTQFNMAASVRVCCALRIAVGGTFILLFSNLVFQKSRFIYSFMRFYQGSILECYFYVLGDSVYCPVASLSSLQVACHGIN